MKKDNNILYLGILFLASLLVELYAFLQFREDTIVIVGTTIIVLVMAYLFWDSLYNKMISYKIDQKEENEARWVELEKLQKAIYMANRNNAKVVEENIDMQKKQADTFLEEIKSIQLQASKFVAKHSREDIKNLVLSQQEEFKKLAAVYQEEMKNLVSTEQKEIQKLLELIEETKDANLEIAASLGKEEGSNTNRGAAAYDVAAITDAISRNGESIRFKVEGGFELVEADLSEIRDQFIEFYKDWKVGKKDKDITANTSALTFKEESAFNNLQLEELEDNIISEESELKELEDNVASEELELKELEDNVASEELELKELEDNVVLEEPEFRELENKIIADVLDNSRLEQEEDKSFLDETGLKQLEEEQTNIETLTDLSEKLETETVNKINNIEKLNIEELNIEEIDKNKIEEIVPDSIEQLELQENKLQESDTDNLDVTEISQDRFEDDTNMLSSEELEAIMLSLMDEEEVSNEETEKVKKEDNIGKEQAEDSQTEDMLYQEKIESNTSISSTEKISNENIEKQEPAIPVDPNKPLSPEEVAALIASMGQ